MTSVVLKKVNFLLLFYLTLSSFAFCGDLNFIKINKKVNESLTLKSLSKKIDSTNESDDINIKDLKGFIILNFWASWCGPCEDEIKDINEFIDLRNTLHPDVKIYGINIFDNKKDALHFKKKNPMDYPNFYDSTNTIPVFFGISGVPETYFLKDNVIIYKYVGKINSDDLLKGINKAKSFNN